jgi:hypothetical protein
LEKGEKSMNEREFFKDFIKEIENEEKDEMEEMREEIREQVKILVMTMEVLWEELQKSNLPEEVKVAILSAQGKKGN